MGFDTEFTRRNTYKPIPELLQLATDTGIALIDLRADLELATLANWFQSEKIQRIGFSIEQDLELLQVLFGEDIGFCEDIQLGVTFLSKGSSLPGYSATVKRFLNIELDKSLQTSNWSDRPLANSQLSYAALDVEHIQELWQLVEAELKRVDRFNWYEEERKRLQKPLNDDPRRLPGSARAILDLGEVGLRLLPLLDRWRNDLAERQNIPTGWVIKDKALFVLAVEDTISDQKLSKVFPPKMVKRNRHWILELQRRARSRARKSSFVPPHQLSTLVSDLSQECERIAEKMSINATLLAVRKDILFALRFYIAQGRFPAWFGKWRIELIGDLIQRAATKFKLGKLTRNGG